MGVKYVSFVRRDASVRDGGGNRCNIGDGEAHDGVGVPFEPVMADR